MSIEVDTVTGPAFMACALINDDRSGLGDKDERLLDAFIADLAKDGWYVVSCEGEPWFTWSYNLYGGDCAGGDVIEYIVHRTFKD